MDIAILREELRIIAEKKQAIERLIAVYENGAVESKPAKPKHAYRRKSAEPTFQDKIVGIAKKICNDNGGYVKVKQALDAATESGIINGKDRNKDLQRVSAAISIARKRGTFERIATGNYMLKQ